MVPRTAASENIKDIQAITLSLGDTTLPAIKILITFFKPFPLAKWFEFKTGCYLSYFKITDGQFSKINLFLSYTAIRGNADSLS